MLERLTNRLGTLQKKPDMYPLCTGGQSLCLYKGFKFSEVLLHGVITVFLIDDSTQSTNRHIYNLVKKTNITRISPTMDVTPCQGLDFVSLDVNITDMLSVTGTPSLSYSIVQHGVNLHTRHFGYRDIANKLSPDDETRHNINSLTKHMVSCLAGIIAANTELDLYSPIKTYLPDFACYDQNLSDQITLIDLLSHRTGLTGCDLNWIGSHNNLLAKRGDTVKTFASLRPVEPFRTSFVYNNWGYEIAGKVLEVVTGKGLHDLLSEHIFEPLGMSRTNTRWDPYESNTAKSYGVLRDLTPVQIGRPIMGEGKAMEAAGGVKSTIQDLTKFYSEFLRAVHCQMDPDANTTTQSSVFRNCPDIITNHSRFPGSSLREQGYGAGLVRGQLPGQLGRVSFNQVIGPEPIVGKDSESRLVLYHHGSMPGSTSCVHLLPELDAFIVVLQNSLAPIDTADFVCQYLLESFLGTKTRNNYQRLATEYTTTVLGHMDRVKRDLEMKKESTGSTPKPLSEYAGKYWNSIDNFFIEVLEGEGKLKMRFQGQMAEEFELNHYEDNTFSWWIPYDDVVKRGSSNDLKFDTLNWAWDPNLPNDAVKFSIRT